MTLKGDCKDMQNMIFRTCTVLPLRDTVCPVQKGLEKCAKFQTGNFKLVCLVLCSAVVKYFNYTKRNENDV